MDGLDGEPPLDWVRRQLGLGPGSPIEPHLGRLLVRVRHPAVDGARPSTDLAPEEASGGDPSDFVERYVIGVDDRRYTSADEADVNRGYTISNNVFLDGGRQIMYGSGIWLYQVGGTSIVHNRIARFPRDGVGFYGIP